MRIDLYGSATTAAVEQSSKIGSANAVATKNKSNGSVASSEDTTTLSSGSDSVQNLIHTALQPVPSRAERVESLKQAVNSGKYQLDAAQIADALSSSDI